jgi:hypothetical protein
MELRIPIFQARRTGNPAIVAQRLSHPVGLSFFSVSYRGYSNLHALKPEVLKSKPAGKSGVIAFQDLGKENPTFLEFPLPFGTAISCGIS